MSGHTEHAFETAIEVGLLSSGGYHKCQSADYDEALALFPADVIGFVKGSQATRWQQLETLLGSRTQATVLEALSKELEIKGALHVLRHGFKCYGKTLRLAYFRPNSGMNPEAAAKYAHNRLTITRQVSFTSVLKRPDGKPKRCIIDVTLAVNGLPVVTVELKNPLTGQPASEAIHQYQHDRDERDRLFAFKQRALVHFAIDPDEAWMTTRLKGRETVFLPFNRGDQHGAGNPPVPGNWKTHYLWDEVLNADSLLDILQRFMHLEIKERQIITDKGVRTVRKETMIFPRYHQLDAVRRLVGHARAHGSGHNYLVQHSAGSGKSNSIAWLAHRLASLHDAHEEKVFHSVVVVTDRRVLDQQLQNTIYQFEHKTGVVEKIDEDTRQLARALSGGTPIIISTIQKFPFIARALARLEADGEDVKLDTAGKRFAVIVDEAHSSQSGETAMTLRGMLNRDGIEAAVAAQLSDEEDDELDEATRAAILREAQKRARQPNLSFFAFTATPKFKTKVLFDTPGPSGESPFHEYSMRQAIEEGFIMDVLANYTTYKRFFGLIKQVENDPEVSRKQAAKALTRYMELHPVNIEQVVSVIVEHFRLHVMHELGGRAKAMVVTGSRLAAVKYKLAFDRYIKDNRYDGIRSLVAFSGTVEDPEDPGASYTEVAMNDGLAESELPEAFERDDYRVLLVAEKYQTGFDQPLLQTMYVVKKLAGVQAVQTLSRLNRMAPGKKRTLVLDFVNKEEDIHKAFKPYYESTPIGENAGPEKLSELQHKLLTPAILTPADVDAFAQAWYRPKREHSGSDHKQMNAVLDAVVQRFKAQEEEKQDEFRGLLTAYRNLYAFLSQIVPYQDSDLEKLYTFVRNFMTKLPPADDGKAFVLDDEVSLRYYRMQQLTDGSIDLTQGELYSLKGPTDVGTSRVADEAVSLSSLVEKLNVRFGTDFNEADQLFFDQIKISAEASEQIKEAAKANNLRDFTAYLGRVLDELFIERMEGNEEIFSRIMTDREFRSAASEHLAFEIFEKSRRSLPGDGPTS
ncbi:type I restriction endonuclease subunit R [Xanthomonas campestris]|uniref:Type I site-specific restriction-modification system, R (Restriction) subunit and related helicases n=1 Tax=Xanthomonas campestris pv. campestris (strain 8004) TaxID=314565 RepID=A0A0H2XBR9_XANC8|nr:type I restriction endonuclease [Xanthomonas campestris]AAY50224.1 Type I site-specific restriction-modification system, R (restriction) subunit and related helicases [Xanthomonas campestris pv. campestris str. 8004]MDZ7940440.1 type I restriction endonuclease [Xanthomonas campestris pv. campestris]MEA0617361.1 type I restriction endonuclease [Xanthomonas campestris pv. campestris]MEA0630029.1 type I restriction endonuclease [Xanthomonas campestris pv. campestris]MEA0637933.1 type I restric